MTDEQMHRTLIGRRGSRSELNTPVLVVELDSLKQNIARMARFAEAKGLSLRPHTKTHKSVHIADSRNDGSCESRWNTNISSASRITVPAQKAIQC